MSMINTLDELKARYRTDEQIKNDTADKLAKVFINEQFARQLHNGNKMVFIEQADLAAGLDIQLILQKIEEFGIKLVFNEKMKRFEATIIEE